MYHEIACLFAAQAGMSELPLSVWMLLFVLSAPALGALSLLAIRTVARAALREELDDLRRRLDENDAAVIDLKMTIYESSSGRESKRAFTFRSSGLSTEGTARSTAATHPALHQHNRRTARMGNS
jgi:hypothetical protein